MNRLNQYLLTHYPLLWNTRVVWVLLANFILHLLFFLSGLSAVSAKTLYRYSRFERIGGGGMYTMAILCALVVLIVWCIYYLRNNAFKNFYRIGKWYLVKEFAIIFIIILSSACYFLSFEYGAHLRIRGITSEQEMVREMNMLNQAMVYVPTNKEDYFILNNCVEKNKNRTNEIVTSETTYVTDDYRYIDSALVKEALQKSGAYSYLHYCDIYLKNRFNISDSAESISETNKRWLLNNKNDSVRQAIGWFFTLLNKYGIEQRLNADELYKNVYRDEYHSLGAVVAPDEFTFVNGFEEKQEIFFRSHHLENVYDLIGDSHAEAHNSDKNKVTWNIIGYLALSLSILLLCYRRFSKRVFLISIVGTLVWTILVGLMTVSSGSPVGFAIIVLLLFAIFLSISLVLLKTKESKTTAGVMLNWQGYIAPFAVMLIVAVINDYYSKQVYNYLIARDEWMAEHYPISHWIVNHTSEIFLVNIVVVALYIAFAFNHWAKKWQLMPEE